MRAAVMDRNHLMVAVAAQKTGNMSVVSTTSDLRH